jgi:hypothetical protein
MNTRKSSLLMPFLSLLMMSGCFACQDRGSIPEQKADIPTVTATETVTSSEAEAPKTETAEKKQETAASSAKTEPAAAETGTAPSASDDSTESFHIATNAAGEILLPELP